jgi:dipeptidyl aminopeptidase/acylaminoacyl peptidase
MRKRLFVRSSAAVVVVLWLGAAASFAQQNALQKKPITHDVYDSWKSIQGTKLSADGVWLAYALTPQDGDGELIVRNLKTNAEIHAARGRDPNFTSDSRFVTFALAPYKKDVDQARKAKRKPEDMPKNGVGVVDLTKGTATVLAEHVKSFRVPDETPQAIVYLATSSTGPATSTENGSAAPKTGSVRLQPDPAKVKKALGTELVIRDLHTGVQTRIADVSEYGLSKNGAWLAYGVSSKTPANDGAFARGIANGARKTLLTGSGNYKGFVFDTNNKQAAFISDRDDFKSAVPQFKLYQWSVDAAAAAELPIPSNAMPVSENGRLEFKGDRLLFGTASPRAPEPDENADLIKVDIWNYKDAELQPMQKVRAEEEKKRNYRAVFNLADKKCVQLATPDMPDVRTGTNHDRVLGVSNAPYRQLISWDGNYDDYYLVSIADGSRRKILEKERFGATLSPGGKYVLYFSPADNNWYAVGTADGQKTNLTKGLGVKFQSETDDHPDYPQPYGQAGWTTGDASVLLYDRYDIWEVKADGTGAHMLTAGAGRRQQIVFRNSRTEAEPTNQEPGEEAGPRRQTEQPAISTTRPLLLSAVDDRTKASGFYRASFTGQDRGTGAPGVNDAPTKLVMLDKAFGTPIKARDADVYTFTLSRFEEFGNLWVSSGAFTDMKKVSDGNPQQAQYNWGRSELIEYVNADGKHLKAILTKPENFDPSKKYPMLVYIYEQLTNGLHRYVAPAPGGSSINVTRYASNGYIILQPDIVYDLGYPGQSALKCVLPAVQTVLSMGFVDPARVGIQGHSWGGYQIAYMITQTNIFRAVEAGAAVGDMFGGYGGIRWGTGMSRAFQYEKTQSRIGVTPWENPLIYVENSPVFWIEKIHTPYLTMANDEDDAVPWQQGIEFFTAMRRLGKEAYMFVYNGEKHGLRQRENQKHWTVHMAEYFDYFFKDAPKPDWMEHGVPYLDKGKRDVSVFYKKTDGK